MKLHFHLFDIIYKIVDGSPLIHMYGRSSDNQSVCVIDEFTPYFFVLTDDIDLFCQKVVKVELEDDDRVVKVLKTEIVEKKLFTEKSFDLLKHHILLIHQTLRNPDV